MPLPCGHRSPGRPARCPLCNESMMRKQVEEEEEEEGRGLIMRVCAPIMDFKRGIY